MTGAVARARIPWPTVLVSTLTAGMVVVVAVAPPSTGVSPFFVRIAELALAGGAAYLIDDQAAPVTAAAPRSLWRRRAASMGWGAGVLVGSWGCIVAVLRSQESGLPMPTLTLEVVVLWGFAVAVAVVLTSRGETEPGTIVAPAVLLLGLSAVIGEQVLHVAIFVPDGGFGDASRPLAWLTAGLACLLVIAGAARDPACR
jgi:hypothetical protein